MDGVKLPLGMCTRRPHPKCLNGKSHGKILAHAAGLAIANQPPDVDAGMMARHQIHFTGWDPESLSEPDSEATDNDPLKEPETTETTYSSRTSFGGQSKTSTSTTFTYTARFTSVTSLRRGTSSHASSSWGQTADSVERNTFVGEDDPNDTLRLSWEPAEQENSLSQQQQCNDSPRVSWRGVNEGITKPKHKPAVVAGALSLLRNRTISKVLPDNARVDYSASPAQVAQCAQELQQLGEQRNMEQENITKLEEAKAKLEQEMQRVQKELEGANQKFNALCIQVAKKEQDFVLKKKILMVSGPPMDAQGEASLASLTNTFIRS